ncbi:DUF4573 domain-containing protein [Streptomyces sp. NPDC005322]|uniref:DUF4573 domain-containing protein n=1 Tax=Streptomyces sp. NPDC005322 TaxID=3157032 RepID=UPI0033AA39CB
MGKLLRTGAGPPGQSHRRRAVRPCRACRAVRPCRACRAVRPCRARRALCPCRARRAVRPCRACRAVRPCRARRAVRPCRACRAVRPCRARGERSPLHCSEGLFRMTVNDTPVWFINGRLLPSGTAPPRPSPGRTGVA